MAEPTVLGGLGEGIAALFLTSKGYSVIERNWWTRVAGAGRREIDLVCEHEGVLVFVEVKTRRAGGPQSGLEAVDDTKRERLRQAAEAYLDAHDMQGKPWRIDLVAVSPGKKDTGEIRHIQGL